MAGPAAWHAEDQQREFHRGQIRALPGIEALGCVTHQERSGLGAGGHVGQLDLDGLVVGESNEMRAGEASSYGQVVLAWTQCEEGAVNPDGHHNVILHEFAHQLDYLDGTADGAPPLSGEQARHWQETMTQAYEHLRQSLQHHQKPWLDPYGAAEPAEFFAVLTEAFYQQPEHLKAEQPEVYEALQRFYRLDTEAISHGERR